jgi:hypothetical protein
MQKNGTILTAESEDQCMGNWSHLRKRSMNKIKVIVEKINNSQCPGLKKNNRKVHQNFLKVNFFYLSKTNKKAEKWLSLIKVYYMHVWKYPN